MTRRRANDTSLTPAEELEARLSGRPAAIMAELERIDAEMLAQGRKLPRLYVDWALRAARHPELSARALWMIGQAQATRNSPGVNVHRIDAEWRR